MRLESLKDFRLVGGTALALQIGHRLSIDIDLFTNESFNTEEVFSSLKQEFNKPGEFMFNKFTPGSVVTQLNGIKIDIYQWEHPFIREQVVIENIRMAHIEDIIAMKLQVISDKENGRYVKKDYFDIAALLSKYDVKRMIDIFLEREPEKQVSEIIEGLKNSSLADTKFDPVMMNGMSWDEAKSKINAAVDDFLKLPP